MLREKPCEFLSSILSELPAHLSMSTAVDRCHCQSSLMCQSIVTSADNTMRMANLNIRLQVRLHMIVAVSTFEYIVDVRCGRWFWHPQISVWMQNFSQSAAAPLMRACCVILRLTYFSVLQSRLRGLSMGFFILCLILYVYIGWASCESYLQVLHVTAAPCRPLDIFRHRLSTLHPTNAARAANAWFVPFHAVMVGLPAHEHRHVRGEWPACSAGRLIIRHASLPVAISNFRSR